MNRIYVRIIKREKIWLQAMQIWNFHPNVKTIRAIETSVLWTSDSN